MSDVEVLLIDLMKRAGISGWGELSERSRLKRCTVWSLRRRGRLARPRTVQALADALLVPYAVLAELIPIAPPPPGYLRRSANKRSDVKELLIALMKRAGISSWRDLSQRSRVNRTTIWNLSCGGKVARHTIQALADTLGVPYTVLDNLRRSASTA